MADLSSAQQAMVELFEKHVGAELAGDLDTTMETMTEDPHLNHVASMAGGVGRDGVRAFYRDHLVGKFFPPDMTMSVVSRTVGSDQVVDELMIAFQEHYLSHVRPYELVHWKADEERLVVELTVDGEPQEIEGAGNGPIAALVDALERSFGITIRILDYHEHAMAASADATAAAYVEADVDDDAVWGVGIHPSIVTASLRAVVNAVNRQIAAREALAAANAAFESA